MKKSFIIWLTISALLFAFSAYAAQYVKGKHFLPISPKVSAVTDVRARHEVVELFWYGCPHCFEFEPYLDMWSEDKAADINLVRIPAIFNPRWEQHARAFYALEMIGDLQQGHELMFDGMHEQGRALANLDSMARFLAAHGIDEAKFREAFHSFAVETKISRAKELIRQYQIRGVPAVIVNGEYRITGNSAGGYNQMIEIIEQLTAQ
jgi:thiol:disulfide interchange protein DsbA